jgi:hypothetical protein
MVPIVIPNGPEAMTPAWLTTALRASGVTTRAAVTSVTWQPLGGQGRTTQLARLTLTYSRPEAGAPATLVTKSSAREASTRHFFGRFYAREVAFYRWVAPAVPLHVPHCYYADYEAALHAHVLLLEDLAPVRTDDLLQGVSVDIAAAYTRCMAIFHAHWWEQPRLKTLAVHFPPHGVRFAEGNAAHLARGLAVMRLYLSQKTCSLATTLRQDRIASMVVSRR